MTLMEMTKIKIMMMTIAHCCLILVYQTDNSNSEFQIQQYI